MFKVQIYKNITLAISGLLRSQNIPMNTYGIRTAEGRQRSDYVNKSSKHTN